MSLRTSPHVSTIACPYCHADAGAPCLGGNGKPASNFLNSHHVRFQAAAASATTFALDGARPKETVETVRLIALGPRPGSRHELNVLMTVDTTTLGLDLDGVAEFVNAIPTNVANLLAIPGVTAVRVQRGSMFSAPEAPAVRIGRCLSCGTTDADCDRGVAETECLCCTSCIHEEPADEEIGR